MSTKVQRSLYRSLLREARILDGAPIAKILWPLPKKLVEATAAPSALYVPGGQKYVPLVKQLFRSLPNREDLGFEVLAKIKHHMSYLEPLLPRVTKDHQPLMEAFQEAQLKRGGSHTARVVSVEPQIVEQTIGRRVDGPTATEKKFEKSKVVVRKEYPFEVKVGMGLIAHPLSSAHVDRRVMLVVEKTVHTTTALVLDMLYTYPLSPGNPMFPEVFWNHEVYNGGYVHVDYTMPPTANVSVLHTLEPPSIDAVPEQKNWLSWLKANVSGGDALPDAPPSMTPLEYHTRLCRPIIRGEDGEPTLYYSQVEALPYLATLSPGRPRSALRVYWGCMKWPTPQLAADIIQGHWIPVEISPSFFGAYTVKPPPQEPPGKPSTALVADEERFLTLEEMQMRRELRRKVSGVDVTPPQTFPPHHPMCRREVLWDQVLFSLGGEHAALVGTVNPFVDHMREHAQRVPLAGDAASLLGTLMGDDDE